MAHVSWAVTHKDKEYVKPGTDIHSNTVEGVFSLLKRGVYGTFHSISEKHLPNYLNEFEFRRGGWMTVRGFRSRCRASTASASPTESVENPPYAVLPDN